MRNSTTALLLCLNGVALLAIGSSARSQETGELEQIRRLEEELFDPDLPPEAADRLLQSLLKPDQRASATEKLSRNGRGHIERIAAFARECSDLEAREACANIVEALDSAYQTTRTGQELGELYRRRSEELLPERWASFRTNPDDERAIALLVHATPEKTYEWLGTTGDRHDRLRYLLLRVRERSPDKFAAERLQEFSAAGVLLIMPELFPRAPHHDGPRVYVRARRSVGHTYLRVIQLCSARELNLLPQNQNPLAAQARPDGLPEIQYVGVSRRWLCLFQVPQLGTVHLPVDGWLYSSKQVKVAAPRCSFPTPHDGLCELPELNIPRGAGLMLVRQNPGWMKHYLPESYVANMTFAPGNDARPPELSAADRAKLPQAAELPAELANEDAAARQRRSPAEVEAARAIAKEPMSLVDPQKMAQRLVHAETAAKLDSTLEDAVAEQIESLASYSYNHLGKPSGADAAKRIMELAPLYFDRFGADAPHRDQVHSACHGAVFLKLMLLRDFPRKDLSPDKIQVVLAAKKILVLSIKRNDPKSLPPYNSHFLLLVGRGLHATGKTCQERQQWVDEILKICRESEAERTRLAGTQDSVVMHQQFDLMWLSAIELSIDDGEVQRAEQLLAELQKRVATRFGTTQDYLLPKLRGALVRMDDAALLGRFDRWQSELQGQAVGLIGVRWPDPEVFPRYERLSADTRRDITPPIEGVAIRAASPEPMSDSISISAFAEGNGGLFVLISYDGGGIGWNHFEATRSGRPSPQIAFLPLNEEGYPKGKPVEVQRPRRHGPWDTLQLLSQPPISAPLQVTDAHFLNEKLYISTTQNGLLVYDTDQEKWSRYTEEQGLPGNAIHKFFLVDDRTLFCVNRNEFRNGYCYVWSIPESKVLRKFSTRQEYYEALPFLFWRDGESLRAWARGGVCENLLAGDFEHTPRSPARQYGWELYVPAAEFTSLAECEKRRFVTSDYGLHEFDATGTFVAHWQMKKWIGEAPTLTPSDCPLRGPRMVATGSHLAFVGEDSVLLWSPTKDTWYGPLSMRNVHHAFGTRAGIWLGTGDGLHFLATETILTAANKAERVITTTEYRNRLQQIVDSMPRLERAKLHISERDFEKAKGLIADVLKEDPNQAEALLIMARLAEPPCANEPQQALGYYRQLMAIEIDRNAAFTGAYRATYLLTKEKRWEEAGAQLAELEQRFPIRAEGLEGRIDWCRRTIRSKGAQ